MISEQFIFSTFCSLSEQFSLCTECSFLEHL
nr:MAG TPA: hypothetical protein [Ackermannviridae sp.]